MKTSKCGNCAKQGHSIRTCDMMKQPSKAREQAVNKAANDKQVSRDA